ncbi:MAG: monovalent cation/H+ antiporter subunit D family protein [Actinomycetia bacterium]|nr:monovalent cation/H+ antiporter subunit D family protein [Actinomycetes bacterium]
MEISSILPIIPILVAGLAAVLIAINGDKAFWRNLWSTIASVVAFLAVITMLPGALDGKIYYINVINLVENLSLTFRVDDLGLLFGLVASSMWVLVNIYTIGYMEHEHEKKRFFAFFALSMFAAFGIAFSENLFTLFIFYEMLSLFTYPLVVHSGTAEAMKAGAKYLIYTLGGGGFLLVAIIVTYFVTGDLSLSQPGIFDISNGAGLLQVLFFMYLIGFGVKAAIMPMHHWLPKAMVAPTPVSTLLHAVAVVKAGVFGVLRLIYNIYGVDLLIQLGLGLILVALAAFTILTASIIATRQDNLKRRLAYSTISQLSYIVLGGALLAPAAAVGAMVHIANHAFTKGTLFMCAGIIAEETGKKKISQLNGIGRRLPLTMSAFTIAALGMIGLPPLAGFVSKWYLGVGAGEANKPIVIAVLVGSSILNAIYFLPIIYRAFFMQPTAEEEKELVKPKNRAETVPTMLVPILTTTTMTVILGVFAAVPGLPMSVAKSATSFLFGG